MITHKFVCEFGCNVDNSAVGFSKFSRWCVDMSFVDKMTIININQTNINIMKSFVIMHIQCVTEKVVEHQLILLCVYRRLDLQVMTSFVDMLLGNHFRQRATDLGCYYCFCWTGYCFMSQTAAYLQYRCS